jgi:hypothetical protein
MLATARYQSQLIVDVEATRATAQRRAYRRWLDEYESAVTATKMGNPVGRFGGRLVPPSAYDWLYPDDTGLTRSLSTALTIEREFRGRVRLIIYRSIEDNTLPELEWDSASGGPVVRHDASGRTYATCVICHRRMFDPESIRRGMGKSCASKAARAGEL